MSQSVVSHELVQKVKQLLDKGRRYFGSSGASLTHQAFNPESKGENIDANLASIGLRGERKTTNFLRTWMKDKPNVVLVDSCHIPGGEEELTEEGVIDGGDTDHVLILGDTVLITDSKAWKSKANYVVQENGEIKRNNSKFKGGSVKISGAKHLWKNYLSGNPRILATVVINPADNPETVQVFRNNHWYRAGYRLVEIGRLEEFLDELYEECKNVPLDPVLVSEIVATCVKPYDLRREVMNSTAIASMNRK